MCKSDYTFCFEVFFWSVWNHHTYRFVCLNNIHSLCHWSPSLYYLHLRGGIWYCFQNHFYTPVNYFSDGSLILRIGDEMKHKRNYFKKHKFNQVDSNFWALNIVRMNWMLVLVTDYKITMGVILHLKFITCMYKTAFPSETASDSWITW